MDKALARSGRDTAAAILDAAEALFAQRGYAGASLRRIAEGAGLQEPGLYNHFPNKAAIYSAVLARLLKPLERAVSTHLSRAGAAGDTVDLALQLFDAVAERPLLAPLLQQAVRDNLDLEGNAHCQRLMAGLFYRFQSSFEPGKERSFEARAVEALAVFNLITGYFCSQSAMDTLAAGDLLAEGNLRRQRELLRQFVELLGEHRGDSGTGLPRCPVDV